MRLDEVRRGLYLTQRAIGDAQAARRGPTVLVKRLVRRRLRRTALSALNRRTGL